MARQRVPWRVSGSFTTCEQKLIDRLNSACDVPSSIYTFPFEPNPNWSAFYASGEEILEYFKATVAKWDLARDVKVGHRV